MSLERDPFPLFTRDVGAVSVELERSHNVVLTRGGDVLLTVTDVARLREALQEALDARTVAETVDRDLRGQS